MVQVQTTKNHQTQSYLHRMISKIDMLAYPELNTDLW